MKFRGGPDGSAVTIMRDFVTTSTWTALAAALIFTAGCGEAHQGASSRAADDKAIRDPVDPPP